MFVGSYLMHFSISTPSKAFHMADTITITFNPLVWLSGSLRTVHVETSRVGGQEVRGDVGHLHNRDVHRE
jgi:hypothetical protein